MSATQPTSPGARSTFWPPGIEPDSVIDVRVVLQHGHRERGVDALPPALLPHKGPFGIVDYEKVFCLDPEATDIFDLRTMDRDHGCVIIVRPDQYVVCVLPRDAHDELNEFFSDVLLESA